MGIISSLLPQECNFIYLTHPSPQGLNSLVLPIILAEPAVVTVIIRIYGGQVLCVTICLLSTHPCTSLQKKGGEEGREGRRREKKKRSHLVLCSYIVFPFIRDKTHMAYLFLAHTAALESTMGSHRAHMNLQERATCKLSVDYLDTWVRPNCEIRFNNRRGSFPSSPFLHPLET